MQGYINRLIENKVKKKLKHIPAVVILGSRQCGKSTLAKKIIKNIKNSIYLDLERPSDINKLQDAEAFFELNSNKLICLDEIQRVPELFTLLRSVIDKNQKNGQFLILGSASRDLIKQTSESLAGRISYINLTPFLLLEITPDNEIKKIRDLWLKGGYPRSYLSSNLISFEWRIDFIRTFLERDIPQLGFLLSANVIRRFWQMCAHVNGQILNASKLGESLGINYHTVQSYTNLLEQTFIIRILHPHFANLKKRLIKSPKIYIRDTGLLHALLDIKTHNDLLGHPIYGSSWEGFVIENILSTLPDVNASYYRTSSGNEIDLIIERKNKKIAIECKASTAPNVTKGFWNAIDDLKIDEAYVIAPVKEMYPIKKNVFVCSLRHFIEKQL